MITTTLNRIRQHSPCHTGWTKLLKHLGKVQADDEPVSFITILESNGVDDCLWCLRVEPQHSEVYRKMAVRFAREVEHLMSDPRSKDALNVAERHANGMATDQELCAAKEAAGEAAWEAAGEAAGEASKAVSAAVSAAVWATYGAAVWATYGTTPWSVRVAAATAWGASWSVRAAAAGEAATGAGVFTAAWASARVAAKDTQAKIIREFLA